MTDPSFGTDSDAFEKEATRLAIELDGFKKTEGIEMDGISRDIMLRKLYETAYGIHNHYAPNQKPLALVTARQKEETYLYSKKAVDQRRFVELGMAQATGMGMKEFFTLPAADCEYMFEVVKRSNKREGSTVEELQKQLEAALESEKKKGTGKK